MHTQLCFVLLTTTVTTCGSADGGKDENMFYCLVFDKRLLLNEGIAKKVVSPPSIALGLNRSRLASLHMLSLGPRATC
jgi:hypothetical protein